MNKIQGCWKRLKIQTKKEHDNQRREPGETGGGKATASPSQVCKVPTSMPSTAPSLNISAISAVVKNAPVMR